MKKRPPKLIFLDRDGVLNAFPGRGVYVTRLAQLKPVPGAARALAILTKAGYELNVISNQGCVSHGMITRKELFRLTAILQKKLQRVGGRIRRFYYCTHQTSDGCGCKKPKIALIHRAVGKRRVDLAHTFFIGDSQEDMMAGRKAGCHTVLVLSGRTRRSEVRELTAAPDTVKRDLLDAARWILRKKY